MRKYFLFFGLCLGTLVSFNYVFALNLGSLKQSYISGDYEMAIKEGEKIMARSNYSSPGMDELYYFLGLSYLKDGNYLRASDIFEIIINEFKSSQFVKDAKLGLADIDYFKGDYDAARNGYKGLLNSKDGEALKPQLSYRLDECIGKKTAAKILPDPVIKDEVILQENYFSVQVGSFTNSNNANNLKTELKEKGYNSFVEENTAQDKISYRVKVGKLQSRREALELEAKLAKDGYPTKIWP